MTSQQWDRRAKVLPSLQGSSPLAPVFLWNLEHPDVGEDPALYKLHDVEVGAYDALVFAQTVYFGDRHSIWVPCVITTVLARIERLIVLVQAAEDAVLALDGMRSGREQIAGRLLAQDVSSALGVGQDVRWVRLSKGELLDLDGSRDLWNVRCGVARGRCKQLAPKLSNLPSPPPLLLPLPLTYNSNTGSRRPRPPTGGSRQTPGQSSSSLRPLPWSLRLKSDGCNQRDNWRVRTSHFVATARRCCPAFSTPGRRTPTHGHTDPPAKRVEPCATGNCPQLTPEATYETVRAEAWSAYVSMYVRVQNLKPPQHWSLHCSIALDWQGKSRVLLVYRQSFIAEEQLFMCCFVIFACSYDKPSTSHILASYFSANLTVFLPCPPSDLSSLPKTTKPNFSAWRV